MTRFVRSLTALFALVAAVAFSPAIAADDGNTVYLDLPAGRVVIELLPNLAPNHVTRFKELVHRGFYDGLTFHRVIPGFMAQTGDPLGDGSGGTGRKIKAEFSNEPFVRGIVGMARGDDPDSADSQFFIMLGPKPALDHQYTVIGRVVSGMEFVDKIKAGDEENNGQVDQPDILIKAQLAAEATQG